MINAWLAEHTGLSVLHSGIAALLCAVSFLRDDYGGLGDFEISPPAVYKAVDDLGNATKRRPWDANASALLGIALLCFEETIIHRSRSNTLALARVALDNALKREPTNYLALLGMGTLAKNAEYFFVATQHHPYKAEAWLSLAEHWQEESWPKALPASFAVKALWIALALSPDSREVRLAVGKQLRRHGKEADAMMVYQEAVARGLWHHPLQRPQTFWPQLYSEPFPGKRLEYTYPWWEEARNFVERQLETGQLKNAFRLGRLENPVSDDASGIAYWVQRCESPSNCWIQGVNVQEQVVGAHGSWAEYTIFDPLKHDAEECVHGYFWQICLLAQALRRQGMPVTRITITEVYPPRTRIPRHFSPQQGRLRLLCPLDVPVGSRSKLIFRGVGEDAYGAQDEGKCKWFDESFEHELEYEGDAPRASLIIDTPHPALMRGFGKEKGLADLEPEIGAPSIPPQWRHLSTAVVSFATEIGLSKESMTGARTLRTVSDCISGIAESSKEHTAYKKWEFSFPGHEKQAERFYWNAEAKRRRSKD